MRGSCTFPSDESALGLFPTIISALEIDLMSSTSKISTAMQCALAAHQLFPAHHCSSEASTECLID